MRGIGEWSAQMHLIFHLGRLDVLATGDRLAALAGNTDRMLSNPNPNWAMSDEFVDGRAYGMPLADGAEYVS